MSTATRSRTKPRLPIPPTGHLPDHKGGSDHRSRPPLTPPTRRRAGVSDDLLTVALAVLMLAAVVPLRGVFIGSDWVRPVVGGVVLSVGIGWGARRLAVGPVTHLVMSVASLGVFLTVAFFPDDAVWGVVPTPASVAALQDLFVEGLELVELRPSPTFVEAGLLLLAVGGTWIVSYLADGTLFVLRSPVRAVLCAIVLWVVPLAIAPPSQSLGLPVVTILAAGALLLLLGNAADVAGFGPGIAAPSSFHPLVRPPGRVPLPGWLLAFAAIVAGLVFASVLPGFRADPLYAARGGSGTTITTNPIVDIRQRLVAGDAGPVVTVTSPRPVYLRTTALDTYDEDEQWTARTIKGEPVQGIVDTPPPVQNEAVEAEVQIEESIERGAVLAPAPFLPIEVGGPKAEELRYDPRSATLTTAGRTPLVAGDSYQVVAALPQPSPEALRAVPLPGPGAAYTDLPGNVPDEVVTLARQIAGAAGAQNAFDAALAIQEELRSWSYSTVPEPGLGATAMLRFIDGREGYCEQFAGTMAVMLRTLGIPARLAVGYTPGDLVDENRWQVTNGNAHAWVEVNFGDLGWIPFEPTPRADGNVLVTSAATVVPAQTQAQRDGRVPPEFDPVGPGGLNDLRNPNLPESDFQDPFAFDSGPFGAAADDAGVPWRLVLGLVAVVAVGAGLFVTARNRAGVDLSAPAAERIRAARTRVERIGRAVGRPRRPEETDEEYFARLAAGNRAGARLADPATRAVYAPAVTVADAEDAESASRTLTHRLTDDLPAWRRGWVAVRSALGR